MEVPDTASSRCEVSFDDFLSVVRDGDECMMCTNVARWRTPSMKPVKMKIIRISCVYSVCSEGCQIFYIVWRKDTRHMKLGFKFLE